MTDENESQSERLEDTLILTPAPGSAAPVALNLVAAQGAAAGSDVGRVRENNEDAFLFAAERGLFAVCDGMGGHAAGEQASALAVRTLDARLSAEVLGEAVEDGAEAVRSLFTAVFKEANQAILASAAEHAGWAGMGTTAVVALCAGQVLYVANSGDSRAYLVRAGAATQLSRDHSVAAVLVEQGQLTPEEARAHPLRNQLIAVLGTTRLLFIDSSSSEIMPGDRLLLCSDGLWDMLQDAEIARIVSEQDDPAHAVRALITAANLAGGMDNITVIVIHLPQ